MMQTDSIDAFQNVLAPLHLLKHPFYQDWMAGKLSRETLRDYAKQYYAHVEAFPRYLSATHSNCENEAARRVLLENLNDEEGLSFGTSHPELWLRFAEGLGVDRREALSAELRPAIQNVITTFFRLSRSSFHEGLGALYAYESQVPEVAGSKIEGLRANYGIEDERTLSFFEVHKTADVHHRAVLKALLDELPEEKKIEALNASKVAAQALWDFLSDVHQESPRVAV